MTTFTKGDRVTLLINWDRRGTIRMRDLVVHSCGRKQMILCNEAGEVFQGTFFAPDGEPNGLNHRILPRLSDADGVEAGLRFAEFVLDHERAHFADRIARWGDDASFRRSIEKSLAALHEPRIVRGPVDSTAPAL